MHLKIEINISQNLFISYYLVKMEQKQLFTQTHALKTYDIDYNVKGQNVDEINKLIQDVIDGKKEGASFYMKYKDEEDRFISMTYITHAIVVNDIPMNILPLEGIKDGDIVFERVSEEFPKYYPTTTVLVFPESDYCSSFYWPKYITRAINAVHQGKITEFKGSVFGSKYMYMDPDEENQAPKKHTMDDYVIVRKAKPDDDKSKLITIETYIGGDCQKITYNPVSVSI